MGDLIGVRDSTNPYGRSKMDTFINVLSITFLITLLSAATLVVIGMIVVAIYTTFFDNTDDYITPAELRMIKELREAEEVSPNP